MRLEDSSVKVIKSKYNAASRFAHPAVIKILNTSNPNNNEYFLLYKKLKKAKKNQTVKLYDHVIAFPTGEKIIIINDVKYKISKLEKELFGVKHIVKRYTLKYKIWLTIQYLKK